MAENLNTKTAKEGHNRSPEFKAEKVLELAAALIEPTKRKDEANKDIIALHRDFRTKTGMTKADFNFAQRLAAIENEEEQDEKMLNMKIAFNALCPNKQLDFISVMDEEKAEAPTTETPITVEEAEAHYGDDVDENKPSTLPSDDESVIANTEADTDEVEADEAGDEAVVYEAVDDEDSAVVSSSDDGGEDAA